MEQRSRSIFAMLIACLFVFALLPVAAADAPDGFETVSWKPVVPVKKATLVQADKWGDIDDYAYLAAVPSSVFYDEKSDSIVSHPLLFYDGGNVGTDYFMEDWLATAGMDELVTINMEEIIPWSANKTTEIYADNPYDVAREVATSSWKSSKTAVLAVIDGRMEYADAVAGAVEGTMPGDYKPKVETITGERDVGIVPVYHNFSIPEPYKYIDTDLVWDVIPGTGVPANVVSGINLDMQLYDWQLGMVAAVENWVLIDPDPSSYVFNNGPWGVAFTYMPTKSMAMPTDEMPIMDREPRAVLWDSVLRGPDNKAVYRVDCNLYPGVEFDLPEEVCFGASGISFELTWNNPNVNMGLVILDPFNNSIAKAVDIEEFIAEGLPAEPPATEDETYETVKTIGISKIGEGRHRVCVVKLTDNTEPVDFKVTYAWEQLVSREEGNFIASATEGAILASLLNAPLLYVDDDYMPPATKSALDALGVKKVVFMDLGGEAPLAESLAASYGVEHITDYVKLYSRIQDITDETDVVFSSIATFGDSKFAGPAAYAAAHHGCPVFLVEMHPELSCAAAWHSLYWQGAKEKRRPPSVGSMVISGREVYDFLGGVGFDGEGMENMLTVCDEFNLGASWDRTFAGVAVPGRITGTPTDASYWVSRSVFYPVVVFANPATDPKGGTYITGSRSTTDTSTGFLDVQPGGEMEFKYPVLQTWVSYQHRFNERASKYHGINYTGADGITPFWSPSDNPVDNDVNARYGRPGCYYPDMTNSEVVPFYMNKLGYSNVYSTNFEATMENLNRGVMMWIEVMHGGNAGGGTVGFWGTAGKAVEENPWRGYEEGGDTFEPDTMAESKQAGVDVVPSPKGAGEVTGHDGVVITIAAQFAQTTSKSGSQIDEALENIHSAGVVAGSCLIAYTPLHMSLVRHGSVFQVIDPWLTSWYCAFAIATFGRDLASGDTVGEAYEKGIRHVGIEYLTGQWWWDIYENVVYFGDPELRLYSPLHSWEKPVAISPEEAQAMVAGTGAVDETPGFGAVLIVAALAMMAALMTVRKR